MFIRILFFLNLCLFSLSANYLVEHSKKNQITKQDIVNQYKEYNKAYDEVFVWYRDNILQKWPTFEYTQQHYFVKYKDEFSKRVTIDFRNGIMILSIISENEKEVAIEMSEFFEYLLKLNIQEIYKTDILFNQTALKLAHPFFQITNESLLLGDVYSYTEKKKVTDSILQEAIKSEVYKEQTIYTKRIMLPKEYISKKEQNLKKILNQVTTKTPKDLIYALIKVQSGYNFMARDTNQSFGLLGVQAVKMSIDEYYKLNGHYQFLDSGYFYDFTNNITIASSYLNKILNMELQNITDTDTKKYIASIVYRYGYEELFSAYRIKTKDELIKKLNMFPSNRVYKTLLKKIKNKEIRNYLFRIGQELHKYNK